MSVIVPTVLFCIFLIGIGASVASYVGQTPYEAIESVKNNHDYTCSESYFDEMYEGFRQIGYANKPITWDDIQKALGMGENLYNGAVEYAENYLDFFLGNFDDEWVADISSRSIRVYNSDGELVGTTEIVGTCDNDYNYSDHITTMPQLSDDGWLLFRTISQEGTFYHTYIEYIAIDNTDSRGAFRYWPGYYGVGYVDKYASNVAFVPSTYRQNGVQIKCVYQGNTHISSYTLISPISGASSDLDATIPYIGVADTPDGEAGVRPDGSVVLPDGTVVYPNSTDGTYPFPVAMSPDWWAKLAAAIADGRAGEESPDDAGTTNLELSGIRALLQSINDKIDGFGDTIKNAIKDFFSAKPSDYTVTTDNWFNTFVDAVKRFLRGFGLNVQ